MINPKITAAIAASGMSHGHATDTDINTTTGEADIMLEGTYTAARLAELAAQMRAAELHYRNATILELIAAHILPDHASADSVALEASEYMTSYGCSAAVAVRDVIDAYHEGEADSAEAARTTDWDYGRE